VITDELDCPLLNIAAGQDRIIPAAAAPVHGQSVSVSAGHVGMIVGSKRAALHAILNDFLAGRGRRR
jgi:polyhydroxyalkanoate synthase